MVKQIIVETGGRELVDRINTTLLKGINTQQNQIIDRYSPNNLKTVVLSQEGVCLTFFNQKSTTFITFNPGDTTQERLLVEKEVLSFLIGERVYSSVEEIIVIQQTNAGQVPEHYSIPKRQIDYINTQLVPRLKRLKSVLLLKPIAMNLRQFVQHYEAIFKQRTLHLIDQPEIEEPLHGHKILVNTDWWQHTQLRPQYYTLDAEDGPLDTYFRKVKAEMQTQQKEAEDNQKVTKAKATTGYTESQLQQAISDVTTAEQLANIITSYTTLDINDKAKELSAPIAKVAFLNRQTYQTHYILDKEVIKITKTTLNEYLEVVGTARETVGITNTQDLVKEMFSFVVDTIVSIYLQPNETTNQTQQVIKQALQNSFETRSKEYKVITDYIATATVPKTLTKADSKMLLSLITLQQHGGLKLPEITTEGSQLLTTIQEVEPASLTSTTTNLVQRLLKIEKGYAEPGPLILQMALHDFFVRQHDLNESYYLHAFTAIEPHKGRQAKVTTAEDALKVEKQLRKVWNTLQPEVEIEPSNTEVQPNEVEPEVELPNEVEIEPFINLEPTIEDETPEDEAELTYPVEDESDPTDEELLEVVEDQEDWQPDKHIQKVHYWLQQLETMETNHKGVQKFLNALRPQLQELHSILQTQETIDKGFADAFVKEFIYVLSELNLDISFRYYTVFIKAYIESLKSAEPLTSRGAKLPQGLNTFYPINGKEVTMENIYLYPRLLTIILRRKVSN